jgi:hypothetical protein
MWLGGTELTAEPDFTWTGVIQEQFGFAVERIGDINRDGLPDWAVGAPYSNEGGTNKGLVYVYYGDPDPGSIVPVKIGGELGGDNFGYSISAAGDFDNDGVDDFIVGAPAIDSGLPGRPGFAYVIFGVDGGTVSPDLGDALRLTGEFSADGFGWSVTDAGDFLGNDDCVAVGAPSNDSQWGLDAGAVYVYEGGNNPDNVVDHVIGPGGTAPGSNYGFALQGVGDWGGSSHTDLAIGAPNNNSGSGLTGRVEIVYGDSFEPSFTGDRFVVGEVAGDQFGYSLARLWDFTQNGSDDVLIGAPFHDQPQTDAGKGYVFEGGSSVTQAANLEIKGNIPMRVGAEANDNYSWTVASAGDFDGDGDKDLAVGAPFGNKLNDAVTGFIHLQDSSELVVPAFFSYWSATWTETGSPETVLLSFAFALPADEFGEVELFRQVRHENGGVLGEDSIWHGPAQHHQEGVPGVLCVAGEGFTYLDELSGDDISGAVGLSYSLKALTADGFAFTLDDLEGPGELTSHLHSGPGLELSPAWPNPANPGVTIRFRAASTENITVTILDLRGRQVAELYRGTGTGQWEQMIWNGRTDRGTAAASGMYFIRLHNGEKALSQRVVLNR